MMSLFALVAIIILMGQYARAEPSPKSLGYNSGSLQNLIMGPNEVDDTDKGRFTYDIQLLLREGGVIRNADIMRKLTASSSHLRT